MIINFKKEGEKKHTGGKKGQKPMTIKERKTEQNAQKKKKKEINFP